MVRAPKVPAGTGVCHLPLRPEDLLSCIRLFHESLSWLKMRKGRASPTLPYGSAVCVAYGGQRPEAGQAYAV